MKKILLPLLLMAAGPAALFAQPVGNPLEKVLVAPSGTCQRGDAAKIVTGVTNSGHIFGCQNINAAGQGTWADVGSGNSSGSATEVGYYAADGSAVSGAPHFLTNGAHAAIGALGVIDPSSFPVLLDMQESSTTATGVNGINSILDWSPTATASGSLTGASFYLGLNMDGQSATNAGGVGVNSTVESLGNTVAVDTANNGITALAGQAFTSGNAAAKLVGAWIYNGNYSDSAAVGDAVGFQSVYEQDNDGASTSDYLGFNTYLQYFGGTMPIYVGFNFDGSADNDIEGGTITEIDGYRFVSPSFGAATVTNQYAIHIGAVTGATHNYAIYSEATAPSVLSGTIQAAGYKSSDGTSGFTGTCAPTTTLTVKNGLITGCS